MDLPATNEAVRATVLRLADRIEDVFPIHAASLRSEATGTRLTNDRWNRIGGVLASFHSVPGRLLVQVEHDRRNLALTVAAVTGVMARVTFGGRDNTFDLEHVEWRLAEIRARHDI